MKNITWKIEKRRRWIIAAAVVVSLEAALASQAVAVTYTAADTFDLNPSTLLGSGSDSDIFGIAGEQEVGYGSGSNTGNSYHAILWSSTAASAVDINPSTLLGSASSSQASTADGTQQVGYGSGSNTGGNDHALLWSGNAATALDLNPSALLGSGSSSAAYGIAIGQPVVGAGSGSNTGNLAHALLWTGGASSAVDLNPSTLLGSGSISYAVSISGGLEVGEGSGANTGNNYHALLWGGSAATALDLNPSTLLGAGSTSFATAISGEEEVGGGAGANTGGKIHALLWSGSAGSAIDLNPSTLLGSGSTSLANSVANGDQVGYGSGANTGGNNHALLWSGTAASAVDLNSLLPAGFVQSVANSIDAYGDIGGAGYTSADVAHAVEWLAGDMFIASSGDWNSSGNWTSGTPAAGNDVLIVPSDGASHSVAYDYAGSVTLGNVTLDETGEAALNFTQSEYTLSATNEIIGMVGMANYSQTGGTNTVGGALTLGQESGSTGNYFLSSGNVNVSGNEVIGNSGAAYFNQIGGTNTVTGNINLGAQANAPGGQYELQGGAVYAYELIDGINSPSSYSQSGGNAVISNGMAIGLNSGTNGSTASVTGGTLLVDGNVFVGGGGFGAGGSSTLTIGSAGTVIVGETTTVLNNGSYIALSSGGTLTTGTLDLQGGQSNLQWTGGTLHLTGQPIDPQQSPDPFSSAFTLNNGMTLVDDVSESIDTSGGSITQNTGSENSSPYFYIGSTGTSAAYDLSGGALIAYTIDVGYNGAGAVTASGGMLNTTTLAVGYNENSTFTLSGATITSSVTSVSNSSTFSQTSGTNNSTNLNIASEGYGSYALSGGTLSTNTINLNSNGTFTQNGGTLAFTTFNQTGGTANFNVNLAPTNATYNLSGGSAVVAGSMDVTVSNGGQFNLSGTGSLTVETLTTAIPSGVNDFNWTSGSLTLTGQPIDFFASGDPYNAFPLGVSLTLNSGMNLTVDNWEWLGQTASLVVQTAGSSNTLKNLFIGSVPFFMGGYLKEEADYSLNAGTLTSSGVEDIGYLSTTYNLGGSGEFIQDGGVNTTVSLNVAYNAPGTYTMNGGQLTSISTVNNGTIQQYGGISSLGPLSGTGSTTVGGGGGSGTASMTVAALTQATVTIGSLGTLKVTGGADNVITSLSITGGQLDITNTQLFINYGSGPDPIASIAAWIASGYASGMWNGTGIMSTIAQANFGSYGIGYADSADFGNPADLPSGTIEIMYTLLGDANLDGKVNGTDFDLMATNFNQAVTNGWDEGDFNYDGKVNGSDFVLLADNFNQFASQSAVSAADWAALDDFAAANGISLVNVPEPGVAGMLAVAGLSMLRRRRCAGMARGMH